MLGALCAAAGLATFSQGAKPNVVLVMADDQGWGDTAYNGHPELKTPHLDAMHKDLDAWIRSNTRMTTNSEEWSRTGQRFGDSCE